MVIESVMMLSLTRLPSLAHLLSALNPGARGLTKPSRQKFLLGTGSSATARTRRFHRADAPPDFEWRVQREDSQCGAGWPYCAQLYRFCSSDENGSDAAILARKGVE